MQIHRISMQEQTMYIKQPSARTSATEEERRAAIRNLNDALRRTGQGGRVVMTAGVAALASAEQAEIIRAVATFDDFDADNDPYGEHDLAILERPGHRVAFKVDCYDRNLLMASPDPTDPSVTCRVMTIMLAEEI